MLANHTKIPYIILLWYTLSKPSPSSGAFSTSWFSVERTVSVTCRQCKLQNVTFFRVKCRATQYHKRCYNTQTTTKITFLRDSHSWPGQTAPDNGQSCVRPVIVNVDRCRSVYTDWYAYESHSHPNVRRGRYRRRSAPPGRHVPPSLRECSCIIASRTPYSPRRILILKDCRRLIVVTDLQRETEGSF